MMSPLTTPFSLSSCFSFPLVPAHRPQRHIFEQPQHNTYTKTSIIITIIIKLIIIHKSLRHHQSTAIKRLHLEVTGAWGSVVLKAVRYKSIGPGIDSRRRCLEFILWQLSRHFHVPGVDSDSKNE